MIRPPGKDRVAMRVLSSCPIFLWLSIIAGRTSSWRTGLWPYSRRLAGDRDPLKTRSPRADNPLVLCQCSAPNHYATRRFAARYCTRRERQARHRQPKPGRQPLPGFRCFWRSLAICHAPRLDTLAYPSPRTPLRPRPPRPSADHRLHVAGAAGHASQPPPPGRRTASQIMVRTQHLATGRSRPLCTFAECGMCPFLPGTLELWRPRNSRYPVWVIA